MSHLLETEGNEGTIDESELVQWLNQNNLQQAIPKLKDENMTLEELEELGEDPQTLEKYLRELHLPAPTVTRICFRIKKRLKSKNNDNNFNAMIKNININPSYCNNNSNNNNNMYNNNNQPQPLNQYIIGMEQKQQIIGNDNSPKITVKIKTTSDKRYDIKISTKSTVLEIKKAIQTASSDKIDPSLQRLIYKGKVLKDHEKICESPYNLKDGHTVILVKSRPKKKSLNNLNNNNNNNNNNMNMMGGMNYMNNPLYQQMMMNPQMFASMFERINNANNDNNNNNNNINQQQQPQQNTDPKILYHDQLLELNSIGFGDEEANLKALIATGGNVQAAINILLLQV